MNNDTLDVESDRTPGNSFDLLSTNHQDSQPAPTNIYTFPNCATGITLQNGMPRLALVSKGQIYIVSQ